MTTTHNLSKASFNNLAALLTGQLFLPEDAAYEQVRQLWNGRVKTQPAAIVRCLSVQDVIHGVVVSLEYRLHPLTTVLSGLLLYPLDQARTVLRHLNEFIATVPDELTIKQFCNNSIGVIL